MQNDNYVYSCCFTGYRPKKFPFCTEENSEAYKQFDNFLLKSLTALINDNCLNFFTGMAMGFDIIAAEAVLFLKQAYPQRDIKLHCIVPFEQQELSFPYSWRERYENIIKKSDSVTVLSPEFFKGCYQKRNEFMVDKSDYVLTWYDGQSGGTRNTLKYAEKKLKYIININTDFTKEFTNSQILINFK